VIDPRRYTLETVAEAHAAVAAGTTDGKVVADVAP